MFQLTAEEGARLRLQSKTSSAGHGGRRYLPYAFTELGVAMLSSVLEQRPRHPDEHGDHASFVRIREIIVTSKDFAARIEQLERSGCTASVIEVSAGTTMAVTV